MTNSMINMGRPRIFVAMEYVVLALCWGAYFFLHSALATDQAKRWLYFLSQTQYRLLYVVVSTLSLLAILWLGAALPINYLLARTVVLRYVGLMLATFGVIIIQVSFRQYRFQSFIGLENETAELKVTGILKYVRHPIYSGTILIVLGYFLFVPTLASAVSALSVFSYLPIGIWLEERKLVRIFGDAYRDYQKRVPTLVPSWKSIFG